MLKKLTIKVLADRMDICGQHLQRLETGAREWQAKMILAAAVALGVRPFVLLMTRTERKRSQVVFD